MSTCVSVAVWKVVLLFLASPCESRRKSDFAYAEIWDRDRGNSSQLGSILSDGQMSPAAVSSRSPRGKAVGALAAFLFARHLPPTSVYRRPSVSLDRYRLATAKHAKSLFRDSSGSVLMNSGDVVRTKPSELNRGRRLKKAISILALPAAVATYVLCSQGAWANTVPNDGLDCLVNDEGDTAASAKLDLQAIFKRSLQKALGGGRAGAAASVVQVMSLMWLNTAMQYQYRFGGTLQGALSNLTSQGGVFRLYQGLPLALIEQPLSRFGITAANVGVLALFDSIPSLVGLPMVIRTVAVTIACGMWKLSCMPVDTSKVALQVGGRSGLDQLLKRVLKEGPAPFYRGAVAASISTAAGVFPWLMTHNYLDAVLPRALPDRVLSSLLRTALIGFLASCVSSSVNNPLKVIKTTQQTAQLSFKKALVSILEKDGVRGLYGRGLKTRLLSTALDGALFNTMWKYFQL